MEYLLLMAPFVIITVSSIDDIRNNICSPEVSLCNDTSVNMYENNTLCDSNSHVSDVTISCPASHTVMVTEVNMEVLYNASGCLPVSNNSCLLQEHKLDQAMVDYVKNSMCDLNKQNCQSKINYKMPTVPVLKQHCGVVTDMTTLIPVLKIKYWCYKHCATSNPTEVYYSYWHTLNKTCTSVIKTERIFNVHALLSHYQIVNLMLKILTLGVPVDSSLDDFKATASSHIPGYCQLSIDASTKIVLGYYEDIGSRLLSFTPGGQQTSTCEQRLMVQNETNSFVVCSTNITSFKLDVITGSSQSQNYWVWYENDDASVKSVFFLAIQIMYGKATVTCGYKSCNNIPLIDVQTTVGTVVETESTTIPPNLPDNITIIAVTVIGAVVIIIIAILVTVIMFKWRHPPRTDLDNQSNNENIEDGADRLSLYQEINVSQMDKETGTSIHNINGIQDTYLTQHGLYDSTKEKSIDWTTKGSKRQEGMYAGRTNNSILSVNSVKLTEDHSGQPFQDEDPYLMPISESILTKSVENNDDSEISDVYLTPKHQDIIRDENRKSSDEYFHLHNNVDTESTKSSYEVLVHNRKDTVSKLNEYGKDILDEMPENDLPKKDNMEEINENIAQFKNKDIIYKTPDTCQTENNNTDEEVLHDTTKIVDHLNEKHILDKVSGNDQTEKNNIEELNHDSREIIDHLNNKDILNEMPENETTEKEDIEEVVKDKPYIIDHYDTNIISDKLPENGQTEMNNVEPLHDKVIPYQSNTSGDESEQHSLGDCTNATIATNVSESHKELKEINSKDGQNLKNQSNMEKGISQSIGETNDQSKEMTTGNEHLDLGIPLVDKDPAND